MVTFGAHNSAQATYSGVHLSCCSRSHQVSPAASNHALSVHQITAASRSGNSVSGFMSSRK